MSCQRKNQLLVNLQSNQQPICSETNPSVTNGNHRNVLVLQFLTTDGIKRLLYNSQLLKEVKLL